MCAGELIDRERPLRLKKRTTSFDTEQYTGMHILLRIVLYYIIL